MNEYVVLTVLAIGAIAGLYFAITIPAQINSLPGNEDSDTKG